MALYQKTNKQRRGVLHYRGKRGKMGRFVLSESMLEKSDSSECLIGRVSQLADFLSEM